MKEQYLICNAHIDPVWLWEWEEGVAEALSTFRTAVEFCENSDGFVFNHNEALLYQWVEEFEPDLFAKIQRLVREKKWHIMGGWFLQPDCNMPSGESITRHILRGRQYFWEKFDVTPSTAINFDSFGHSRGLVQILKKSGYNAYIVCRPGMVKFELSSPDFRWQGYDGSEIIVHYSEEFYSNVKGQAALEFDIWMKQHPDTETGLWLWGIGDHGGGPSQKDLQQLNQWMTNHPDVKVYHSVPESYFKKIAGISLPVWKRPLTPELTGCYVNQIRIKQQHRRLEDQLYFTEKLLSMAAIQEFLEYPKEELRKVERALLEVEFHDVLPGSAIQPVEEASLQKIGYGLEILSQLRVKALLALSGGQTKVTPGESPILVYNPHPYPIDTILECEFVLPEQNKSGGFLNPIVYQEDQRLLCQPGITESNFAIDWRKRAVFWAHLEPCSVTRFNCRFERFSSCPEPISKERKYMFHFCGEDFEAEVNCKTGTLDRYCVHGIEYLLPGGFLPEVYEDGYDTWHFEDPMFKNKEGSFTLMPSESGSEFSGLKQGVIPSVRVIEEGEIRTVIEAVMQYKTSRLLTRYFFPKKGREIHIEVRLFWQEKNRVLKLTLPTTLKGAKHWGQTVWGMEERDNTGMEDISLRWCGLKDENSAITVINNGTYASSVGTPGELRLTLVRSTAYSSSDCNGIFAISDSRYTERMDQGERIFHFWFQAGESTERFQNVDKEAQLHGEAPFALAICPSGTGKSPSPSLFRFEGGNLLLESLKLAEDDHGYILRVRNPTSSVQESFFSIPYLSQKYLITLKGFEVKTYRWNPNNNIFCESPLLE